MHSANTVHEQFTLGPLLDLLHLSSSLAVIGTCNSTFSASAGVIGAYRRRYGYVDGRFEQTIR